MLDIKRHAMPHVHVENLHHSTAGPHGYTRKKEVNTFFWFR